MTIRELIDALEDAARMHGDQARVVVADPKTPLKAEDGDIPWEDWLIENAKPVAGVRLVDNMPFTFIVE